MRRTSSSVLTGRVALITGAGSGIGRATAELFAEQGAAVMVADVNSAGEDVVGLTRTAAIEHGRNGIRVNAIAPGFTRTAMVNDAVEDFDVAIDQFSTRFNVGPWTVLRDVDPGGALYQGEPAQATLHLAFGFADPAQGDLQP